MRVSFFGFCSQVCGFFRFFDGLAGGVFGSPLLSYLGFSLGDLDFEFLGLFSSSSGFSFGDCFERFVSGLGVETFDFSVFLESPSKFVGDVAVVCLDNFDLDAVFRIVERGLEVGYSFVVLGYSEELLGRFLASFVEEGKILVVGDLFGYFDDVAFSTVLGDYLKFLGVDFGGFEIFRGYRFGGGRGSFSKRFPGGFEVVSVNRNVKEGFVYSSGVNEFSLGDRRFSLGFSFVGDNYLSLGAKLFDLVLVVYFYNKLGFSGFPDELKRFAFLNYDLGDVLYWDVVRRIFDVVKEDFHGGGEV